MRIARMTIFIATLAIANPVYCRALPFPDERYRVTLKGGGLGIEVNETVLVSLVTHDGPTEHWIAERLQRNRNWCGGKINDHCSPSDKIVHDWIDGKTCPALRAAFEGLANIQVSGFAPPARSGAPTITDTPLLTVSGTPDHMSGYGARLTLAGFTGPVVDWWAGTDSHLSSCWTNRAPESRGKSLEAKLTPIY